MLVLETAGDLRTVAPQPLHLAIGVFDGVHRGHQAVIGSALRAAEDNGSPVIVTFRPHPIRVLAPEKAPRLLTSSPHQLRIFACQGVASVLVIPFDRNFSRRTGGEFVNQLVNGGARIASIAVGENWVFGCNRSGNVALLRELGAHYGFDIHSVAPVRVGETMVSSTAVRAAVEAGEFAAAAVLLGRDYTVLGDVVQGRQMGRSLGFPTANLSVHNEQLPPSGVYAVSAALGGSVYPGVANLGFRPSVDDSGGRRLLEVHLFDFEREIYGEELEVTFGRFLRPEKKFPDLKSLKEQIAIDILRARQEH